MPNSNNNKLSPMVMETLDSLWKLEKIILNTLDFHQVLQKVVDSILTELGYLELGYKVVVLALVDKDKENLKRVALSSTKEAQQTREVSEMPFDEIVIPMTATNNLCIKAILENKPQITHYFPDILTPPISKENAIRSQENAGIKTSMVYPLTVRNEQIGIMIFSMTKGVEEVTNEEKLLIQYFTDLSALAVQNSRLYSNLERESKELERANIELKRLDQAKDDFISITSHELRTPMTIIKSYLWMLACGKGGQLNQKQAEYVQKATKGTERMLNLINDMLNVSRMEQGRMELKIEKINLAENTKDLMSDFALRTEQKDLAFNVDIPESLPPIHADSVKLEEILTNLIGNSLKFTDHGSISVNAEVTDDNFVKISVIDTGKGIIQGDMKNLFHKFGRLDYSYQTVAESGGTGLGLYIVKLYIETMGGQVGVSSPGEGQGSTFWFTLPINKTPVYTAEQNNQVNLLKSLAEEPQQQPTQ